MTLRPIARRFMIGVGIAATLVIVLLQVFPEISNPFPEKVKEPQTTEQGSATKVISTPTDAVPGGAPMQVNEAERSLIETLFNQKVYTEVQMFAHVLGNYLSVLLRVCISPNAP